MIQEEICFYPAFLIKLYHIPIFWDDQKTATVSFRKRELTADACVFEFLQLEIKNVIEPEFMNATEQTKIN